MASNTPDWVKAPYLGKTLHDVSTPSAVLDLAKLEVNCQRMLDATERLGLEWRAHIKTHKTIELTRMQVGEDSDNPANVIVSTILEAERVCPLIKSYSLKGRPASILLSFPLFPSAVDRLVQLCKRLDGPVGVLVDHPSQLEHVEILARKSEWKPDVFIKVDMGYGRAGVVPGSQMCEAVIDAVKETEKRACCTLIGIYAHAGHSYEARDDWQALDYLAGEFRALEEVAASIRAKYSYASLVLSVGATPTATAFQHPSLRVSGPPDTISEARVAKINDYLSGLRQQGYHLEVHAGVYPTLDLQQLATHARDRTLLSSDSLAFTVLGEVSSIYPGRGPRGTTEALINAGCLALGREPCANMGAKGDKPHYSGWGIVMPWNGVENPAPTEAFPQEYEGWQVGKISQEHGILRWTGEGPELPLQYGQRVRIWPNHACIAGSQHGHYLVVDSRRRGKEDEIIDVWERWSGW